MGKLNYYARDLYPENGYMETSLLGVPGASEQRTLETDEKTSDEVEKAQAGGNKKSLFITVAAIIGIIAGFAILQK